MKPSLIFLLVILPLSVWAQDIKKEINDQVWKPLITGYNNFDTEKFMSVYSKEVVRVPVDEKKIFNYTDYRKNVNRENQFNKNYKIKAALEIRFTERIHTPGVSYEQGIMQIKMTDNNGQPATIYSAFQVVLKKETGTWKITFDSDSSKASGVTEKEFMAATPM